MYGIGICLDFIKTMIPNSTLISEPTEILNAVFSIFSKALIPQRAAA